MLSHLCRKASSSVAVGLVAAPMLVVAMGVALGVGAPLGALLGVAVALGVLQDWRWLAALEVALGVRVSLGASPGLASPLCIPLRSSGTCQNCPLLRQHSLTSPPEADIPIVEEV